MDVTCFGCIGGGRVARSILTRGGKGRGNTGPISHQGSTGDSIPSKTVCLLAEAERLTGRTICKVVRT